MQLSGKKVLITGADGFIGSHLVEKLIRLGCDVRAFSYYNSFNHWGWLETLTPEIKQQLEIITGDIRDTHRVKEAVDGCQVVLHLAAIIAIPYSYSAPMTYIDVNVNGTLNLLMAARDAGVEKFVHTSTSEVYGSAQSVPISEQHRLHAQSPYAASKIAADQLAISFYHSFDLPVVIARPFNTYGPRQSMRAVIPTVIMQIANHQSEIKLGSLYPTRDFNFIDDTVKGFIAMASTEGILGEVINLGSNYEISIGDTVNLIAKLMGKEIHIVSEQNRIRNESTEVDRLWADNSKAYQLMDWKPEYSTIEGFTRGLQQTITWFCNPNNMKFYKPDIYNI